MKFSPTRTYTYKMKSIQTIFSLIVSVLLTCSCGRELPFDDPQKGNGKESICISLNTSNEEDTKAGTAKDGDVMNNIYIWIADGSDNIVYKGSYVGGIAEGCSFELAGEGKTATAVFTNVERGEYTLYVIANLPSSLSGLKAKATADNEFKNAVLPGLVDNEPPFTDADGMPLSMRQSIHVGPGINTVETHLVRVCGRIRVTVRNMTTDKNIFIQSFQLTDKNPSTGYIFHKDDHGTPDGITFGAFESYELTGTQTTRYIAPGGEDTYIDQYLYETGLTGMGTLGFEIIGGIYEKSVTNAEVEETDLIKYEYKPETVEYAAAQSYLIKNLAGNFYLYSDGSSLSAKVRPNIELLLADKDLNAYLWNFSSTGSPVYIKNKRESENTYMNVEWNTFGMTSFQSNVYTAVVNNGLKLASYYTSYMLCYSNGLKVDYSYYNPTDPHWYWTLIPINQRNVKGNRFKDSIKNFERKNSSITYIDNFGLPVTLEHICRNDDVNVVINVFYSPESGVLYFRVEDWTDVSNNTTFD